MDLDAYSGAHAVEWRRLEQLTAQPRLTSAEADELLDLYERGATHLSVVRSAAPDPTVVGYLSWLLTRARSRAVRPAPPRWSDLVRFLSWTFPAALYRLRWWWMVCAAAAVVLAIVLGWWFLAHPGIEAALQTPAEIDRLVNSDFENYYSEHAAASFAFQVWTNNAWVAALCIAFGALGVPVVYLLWQNIFHLALVGSIMIRHGRGDLFFGLILPHGLLELTAVFVAAGVGMRFFWSWIEPGERSRGRAFAEEGRTAVGVALGLGVVLLVSGLIEAFVTPSGLPTGARITIGVLAEAGFLGYVFTLGRKARAAGADGDVGAGQTAAYAPARA